MDPLALRVATRFRQAAGWDHSILPLTKEDLEEMDEEERQKRLVDELDRAADLLQALVQAFPKDLGQSRNDVAQAAKTVIQAARRIR